MAGAGPPPAVLTRLAAGAVAVAGIGLGLAALRSPGGAAALPFSVAAAALVVVVAALLWLAGGRLERVERARAAADAELSRRLSELFSLQELSYLLSESLQLERIVDQVVRFSMRFLDARGALIALAGDDHGNPIRVVAADGTLADLRGEALEPNDPGLAVRSLSRERMELLARDSGAGGEPVPIAAGRTARNVAAVPLRAHGVPVGTLVVAEARGGTGFQPEDVRLVSTVATHTAIAVANARFFEMVRSAKEQWETAFDALTEGIAVVDGEGRIRRANRALVQLLGLPLSAAVGRPLGPALTGESEALMALLDAARAGGGEGERPAPMITRSEPLRRTLRITAAPIARRPEELPRAAGGVVVLVEDVTDQRALERQLIQNERLAAVGQLVSGVAHELNNPLTSIAGLSEFLLEQPKLGPGDREHLRVIHDQAERAGRIVRNLLTFARRGRTEVARVDLTDLIQRTLALMSYDFKLKDIDVHRHFRRNLPEVLGDRYALQQVVLNLVTNAAQAVDRNPPGQSREVWVETALEDSEVVIRVRDNGPGIPEEHLPQLFEPFFTTKPVGEGTGLGLSISYTIVQNHEGRLTVETPPPPAGGVLFTVRLPAAPKEAPPPEPRQARPSLPDVPVRYSRGGREAGHRSVLLVDDDPAVQRLVAALFGREGHSVDACSTGSEALERLGGRSYDLVIADVRAAVGPGRPFIEAALQQVPDLKSRLLVASGDVRPEADERLVRLGVPHLRKPFNLRELREKAEQVWEPSRPVA